MGAPLPAAPPCILHRRFPRTGGDWHCPPLRVRAPCRGDGRGLRSEPRGQVLAPSFEALVGTHRTPVALHGGAMGRDQLHDQHSLELVAGFHADHDGKHRLYLARLLIGIARQRALATWLTSMLEKSSLLEPLIDRRSPRCSPGGGISIITRPCFARVAAPSCSSSARWVLDREPEQLAALPFVGRFSVLVKFSLQLRSCTPASAFGTALPLHSAEYRQVLPPSSPLARFDLSLSTAK